MKQVRDDLLAAVLVLNERGWCQKGMEDADGHVCLVGALRVATVGKATVKDWKDVADRTVLERFHAARTALHKWLDEAPTVWNDTPGRTAYQVKFALLQAARRA